MCPKMIFRIESKQLCSIKIGAASSNALEAKKDMAGQDPNLASARTIYYGRGYASLNK